MCLMFADKFKCSHNQFHIKMEGAKQKIFNLEQRIRSLNIQLDEERETKADLEIENLQLKKKIDKLQRSLELVNNNCYVTDVMEESSTTSSCHDKENEDMSLKRISPVPFASRAKTIIDTHQKTPRRRSMSVDCNVGAKTVIVPELCQFCDASRMSKRPEDSPTLPWCPHKSSLNSSVLVNGTQSRLGLALNE